jgi:hypothetical protein
MTVNKLKNKNNYLFIYFIEYLSVLYSGFLTYIIYDICEDEHYCTVYTKLKKNNEILYNSADFFHWLYALSLILHMINEIKREISLSNYDTNNNLIYEYSFKSLVLMSISNIIISSAILLKYSTNITNIITSLSLHILILLPLLIRSYYVLNDNIGHKSAILTQPLYYTSNTKLKKNDDIVDKGDISSYNIVYPEGVYI